MSADPPWMPELISLESCGGKWDEWILVVYERFRQDMLSSPPPTFRGIRVGCRRDPICQGKEAGFWHCVSEGKTEAERIPDLRRCERIGWVKAILVNADDPLVEVWENERDGERRILLWFREEFLVVLSQRKAGYAQLITAYLVEHEHSKRKLRQERDAWRAKMADAASRKGNGIGTPSADGG
jgi:hypothetical protein